MQHTHPSAHLYAACALCVLLAGSCNQVEPCTDDFGDEQAINYTISYYLQVVQEYKDLGLVPDNLPMYDSSKAQVINVQAISAKWKYFHCYFEGIDVGVISYTGDFCKQMYQPMRMLEGTLKKETIENNVRDLKAFIDSIPSQDISVQHMRILLENLYEIQEDTSLKNHKAMDIYSYWEAIDIDIPLEYPYSKDSLLKRRNAINSAIKKEIYSVQAKQDSILATGRYVTESFIGTISGSGIYLFVFTPVKKSDDYVFLLYFSSVEYRGYKGLPVSIF
ncbi:MAG: hypothetical protein EAZ89_09120 [Bacteroidetes bacterium]|nr:MAG: hypothetical protein EAZ89_09120 [Bacteroidota bacterium]